MTNRLSIDYEHQFETIVDTGVRCFLFLGVPAILCLQLWRLIEYGLRIGAALQLAATLMLCLAIILHRRLTFSRRNTLFILGTLVYGAAGLAGWGLFGQGGFILFVGCILAAIMGNSYLPGLCATLAAVVVTALIGLAHFKGWLAAPENLIAYHSRLLSWFATSTTIGIASIVIAGLLVSLKQSWLSSLQTLGARESELSSILRNTPNIIFRLGPDGTITYINRAVTRYGYAPDELIGRPWQDFIYRDDFETIKDLLVSGGPEALKDIRFEVRLFPKRTTMARVFNLSVDTLKRTEDTADDQAFVIQGVATDITERIQAEASLREREQLLNLLVLHTPAAVAMCDRQMRYLAHSRRWISDYGLTEEKIVGRSHYDIFPDLPVHWKEEHRRVLKGATIEKEAEVFPRADGSRDWVKRKVVPWRDRSGKVGGLIMFTEVITMQKEAEERLRGSERRLAQIINFLPDPTFVIDTDSKVIAWNRAIEELTGVKAKDMLGKSDYEYAIPFYGERRPIMIDLVRNWNPVTAAKYLYVHEKDGVLFSETKDPPFKMGDTHFWNTACPLYDDEGQVIGAIESIRDITEQRAAEKALIESEKRFRDLVETLPFAVCIVQAERIVYSNPHYRVICGPIPVDGLLSGLHLHPDDRHRFNDAYQGMLGEDTTPFSEEFRLQALPKTGGKPTLKWVHCIGCGIRHQGRPAVLISMVDTTRIKELEKMMRTRDKMVSLGQVSAGIAHEIRNPLSGINVLLDGIMENFEDRQNAQDIKGLIAAAQKASAKISAVISRVLDFARPCAPDYRQIDPNQPLKEAVALSQTSLRKSGIALDAELDDSLPRIHADGQLIEQVILNLINNAASAAGESAAGKTIRIRSWCENGHVWVSVADSGPGVSEEEKDKVFEPFYTSRNEGTGIGLSICQRIICDHGGDIDLVSSDLGGADFRIRLPLNAANSRPEEVSHA